MRVLSIFLFVFLALGAMPVGAFAQSSHCEDVESTADVMNCVNRHHTKSKERLNTVFNKLLEERGREVSKGLRTAQQSWLVYRDLQCGWEADQVETSSLKRLHELSCLANLTEARADILALDLKEESEREGRKFSTYPRWMNVLAYDNPDIYWRYGKHLRADLDCDEHDERVMVGLEVVWDTTGATKTNVVIAVAENPATGKPQTSLFHLPVDKTLENAGVCEPDVDISLVPHPLLAVKDTKALAKGQDQSLVSNCKISLQIKDKACRPLTLYWSGESYQFSPALAAQK